MSHAEDDVLFDVDMKSCVDCGRALHPGFSDFTLEGDNICSYCLEVRYGSASDLGAEDMEDCGFVSGPDAVRRVFLQDKVFMRNCSQCGNWYEDGTGIKSVFGFRLCPRCYHSAGFGAFFFRG
jgi:hypothetical protein